MGKFCPLSSKTQETTIPSAPAFLKTYQFVGFGLLYDRLGLQNRAAWEIEVR